MTPANALDAVERLIGIATDYPGLSEQVNPIVLGILKSKGDGMTHVVRILPDKPSEPAPKPARRADPRFGFKEEEGDCHCEGKFYTVHEAAPIVGFDHQTVAKWCKTGRIRAEKAWRLDRRGGRVRSWRISEKELNRVKVAGLLSFDMGRNSN